ncbi:hypothetical protein N1031_14940 [Herbiconiux moechotypicola]|uniref:Uncharacterized protein n=1 Tax=Herbiconiux moechotypicola TaxID=637393 RepID=A0ABN3DU69_9MICO|nr:hypothetical protein [Herbiconiux moechotypicola]MCS5731060.1 hypothetical protein [Herbiconiux moechotypicola]
MNTTAARLVVALRVAYVIGAALFVLDVVIAVVATLLIDTEPIASLAALGVFDVTMDWVAVIAFAFAAIGAVLTVLATSELIRGGAPELEPPAH